MRDEIITAIQKMVQEIIGKPVIIGSVPPLEGYAVGMVSGAPSAIFRKLDSSEEFPVLFNGKSADQAALAVDMERVHYILTTSRALPFSDSWQIYAIETTASPTLIGREENINWVYGSSFRVKFYQRGALNG